MSIAKYIILPLLIVLIVLIVACKTTKEVPEEKARTPTGPRLIFITYKITQQEGGGQLAEVLDKAIVAGKMKVNKNKIPKEEDRFYQIRQLDLNKEVLEESYYVNALVKDVEYVGEDGLMGRKLIELESADMPIRMQLNDKAAFIALSIVSDPQKELSIISL